MERENQRVAITKRLLKESLLKILQEKALDAVSVSELCREAGINRATFYRHYAIPRDVLLEIQRDLFRQFRQQVTIPRSGSELRPVIEKLCFFMDEHMALLRILVQCNSDQDFAQFLSEVYGELIRELDHVQALKNLSPEDLQFLMLYSAGGSYFVLRSWILGSMKKRPEEMADYIYSLLFKTEALIERSRSEWKIT